MLANIYFRRFLKAWDELGYDRKFQSRIVSYADDFVILTRGRARAAQEAARTLLTGIGLAQAHINENYFEGQLDDLRIYTRALSAKEVADLAKAGTK